MKTYTNMSPQKFFSQCYKARSGFVHSGMLEGINIIEANAELKEMVLDLLDEILHHPQGK